MKLFVAFIFTLSVCCLQITGQMSNVSSSPVRFQGGLYPARVFGAVIFVWWFAFIFGVMCSLTTQDKGVG